ncbi:hypothetical protein [Paraburkholderia sp. GAS348]
MTKRLAAATPAALDETDRAPLAAARLGETLDRAASSPRHRSLVTSR